MTKPTITDEDRAAAWSDKVCELVDAAFEKVSRNPSDYEEHLAYRLAILAAFNAGMERAAVIASKEAQGWLNIGTSKAASNMTAAKYKARHQAGGEIVAKIRAEKEKPQ